MMKQFRILRFPSLTLPHRANKNASLQQRSMSGRELSASAASRSSASVTRRGRACLFSGPSKRAFLRDPLHNWVAASLRVQVLAHDAGGETFNRPCEHRMLAARSNEMTEKLLGDLPINRKGLHILRICPRNKPSRGALQEEPPPEAAPRN